VAIKKVDLRRVNVYANDITLAVDVYNDAGVMIAPAGKQVDNEIKEYLIQYGKSVVTVNAVEKESGAPAAVEEVHATLTAVKEVEFTEYKQEYAEVEEKLTGTLGAICRGEAADFDETFEATDALLNKLHIKSDVFLYMNFMRDYDNYTAVHSNHVAMLSNIFGQWLKLPKDEIETLTVAGAMHDVGKIELPVEILNKPGKLTPEEKRIVRAHATKGYLLLKKYDLPKGAVMGAYSHHEKPNGTGYPLGLTGDKIDTVAKIIAIVDTYDEYTTYRPYRERMCPFEVIRMLEVGMYGELDTEMLLIFLRHIAANYVGAWATLSNGAEAKIVFIHPTNISKPIVQTAAGDFIDLSEKPDLKIVNFV
jgi:HD-GYP domain-containing protein (c-di-GMP phosphodiesterase class II)